MTKPLHDPESYSELRRCRPRRTKPRACSSSSPRTLARRLRRRTRSECVAKPRCSPGLKEEDATSSSSKASVAGEERSVSHLLRLQQDPRRGRHELRNDSPWPNQISARSLLTSRHVPFQHRLSQHRVTIPSQSGLAVKRPKFRAHARRLPISRVNAGNAIRSDA